MISTLARTLLSSVVLAALVSGARGDEPKTSAPAKISYYKQVRPIFQANCQGCHQPAKSRGEYVMTSHERLLAGGDSGKKAIVAGQPEKSFLIAQITPKGGKAAMPEGKKPLDADEIALVSKWIKEGAVDDTPANAVQRYDDAHPPVYTHHPAIPSLDFSPDGKLLAAAGFHEVLLLDSETGRLAGRLIGMAERIQAVRFSPDGKKLAVAGGLPGRMGEVQVWDVAKQKLKLSVPLTYDTIFGACWSPDGTKLSLGCTDKTVRVIDADSGEQLMQQGSHDDWVLDTLFTVDGSHVVSAGRDMSVKLTEVATQRFVDNVTSITPGALKGGVQALARHPKLNVFVAGGSDGIPRAYRIFRETSRVIGDDANLIGPLYPLIGRVFNIRFSADGKQIAAGSSLDGKGEIIVCSYDYTEDVPKAIIAIMGKVPGTRSPQDKQILDDYRAKGMREIARIPSGKSAVYALAFRPDGKQVAAAGSDGIVRYYETSTGKLVKEFSPAPLSAAQQLTTLVNPKLTFRKDEPLEPESLPKGAKVTALSVVPSSITLTNPFAATQILVTAKLDNGDSFDATRLAQIKADKHLVITPSGLVRPLDDGATKIQIVFGGKSAAIPVKVSGMKVAYQADFIRDVNPILGRLGCNQGTCHGANKGRNGFKLSLRGVDAGFDVRAFVDDHAGRRVNFASPDDSLALLKATSGVPHVGGQLIRPGEPYYELIRNWIARGSDLNLLAARVQKIEIQPTYPVIQRPEEKQQFRVIATYTDGLVKDVTREAIIESGGTDIATHDKTGLLTAQRRGEVPVLARFEGAYVATTLLVMGDRTGFVWKDPPVFNRIDELTAAKWKRMKIQPSALASDLEFLRRVYLDLIGLPPTTKDIDAFLKDTRETQVKRDAVIDQLIGSPEYIEFWTNKWGDMLTVNRKYLGTEGATTFRDWIRKEVADNTPYDVFARKVLTATGSNKVNPPASYFKVLRDPLSIMENTTHLFLGVRFNCNKCHDHPFERWTQDQYYQTAAFFAKVSIAADPASGKTTVGGTAVVAGRPLFEIVSDNGSGDVKHDRTGQVTAPKFPYPVGHEIKAKTRREELANWITSPDNPYFAKSYVNRLWGYHFGAGIIDPIDDLRAGNPPTNPELLDYLTKEFVASQFDIRKMHRLICTSRTYQLSIATNEWNEDDRLNYSHAIPRRLPAEVLYDTLLRVTGSQGRLPGGGRAASLPDSGVDLPTGFLATFGRPTRDSACECERSTGMQLGPVMALVNGSTLAEIIAESNNGLAKLVAQEKDDSALVHGLFVRILNRPPTAKEVQECLGIVKSIPEDHKKVEAALKKREAEVAELTPKLEAARTAGIAKAQAELDAHQKVGSPGTELEFAL